MTPGGLPLTNSGTLLRAPQFWIRNTCRLVAGNRRRSKQRENSPNGERIPRRQGGFPTLDGLVCNPIRWSFPTVGLDNRTIPWPTRVACSAETSPEKSPNIPRPHCTGALAPDVPVRAVPLCMLKLIPAKIIRVRCEHFGAWCINTLCAHLWPCSGDSLLAQQYQRIDG